MYIYISEPQTSYAGLWIFGFLIVACFGAFIVMLVIGGNKKQEPQIPPGNREPRFWDDMYVLRTELDEHEEALTRDTPPVLKVQRN